MATKQIAQGIASLGRHGDSVLVHMQPDEVHGLQALAKANGTSLTINPHTGLPEAFNLGGFFSSILPTVAGMGLSAVSGGALSPLTIGLITGGATGLLTGDPLKGLMGGLGGYGGAGLGSTLSEFGANAVPEATKIGEVGNAIQSGSQSTAQASNMLAHAGSPGISIPAANNTSSIGEFLGNDAFGQGMNAATNTPLNFDVAANAAPTGGAGVSLPNNALSMASKPTGFDALGAGISKAVQNPGQFVDKLGGSTAAMTKLGLPIGGAVLAGMEPSDIGLNTDISQRGQGKDKYDPNAKLNLNFDTGLRLYAQGGPISFAEGGLPALDAANKEDKQIPGADNPQTLLGMVDRLKGDNWEAGPIPGADNPQTMLGMINRIKGEDWTPGPIPGANNPQTVLGAIDRIKGYGADGKKFAIGGSVNNGGIMDLYGASDSSVGTPQGQETNDLSRDGFGLGRLDKMARGGYAGFAAGGYLDAAQPQFVLPQPQDGQMQGFAKGGYLDGAGDGMSDSIPATIEGKQPARLADGEFVIPADVVSHLGNGSTKAGAKNLYKMLDRVRQARTGKKTQGRKINPHKLMPA